MNIFLISDSTDWFIDSQLLPNPECPIIFDNIQGECEVDKQGSSYNMEEVIAVIAYVKRLLCWSEKKIHPSHIGIVFIFFFFKKSFIYFKKIYFLHRDCNTLSFTVPKIGRSV